MWFPPVIENHGVARRYCRRSNFYKLPAQVESPQRSNFVSHDGRYHTSDPASRQRVGWVAEFQAQRSYLVLRLAKGACGGQRRARCYRASDLGQFMVARRRMTVSTALLVIHTKKVT